MFSSTTIASSTTRPIASTIASSVSVLMLKLNTYISAKAPINDTGMVIRGMMVARKLRRNRKMTSATSRMASQMVPNTALIACSINSDVS